MCIRDRRGTAPRSPAARPAPGAEAAALDASRRRQRRSVPSRAPRSPARPRRAGGGAPRSPAEGSRSPGGSLRRRGAAASWHDSEREEHGLVVAQVPHDAPNGARREANERGREDDAVRQPAQGLPNEVDDLDLYRLARDLAAREQDPEVANRGRRVRGLTRYVEPERQGLAAAARRAPRGLVLQGLRRGGRAGLPFFRLTRPRRILRISPARVAPVPTSPALACRIRLSSRSFVSCSCRIASIRLVRSERDSSVSLCRSSKAR